jgi:ATP-dependent Clp protease ATP-binding subunit ClpC
VFERFTSGARRAVVLSQEAARGLNHNYIGTEHLLLGLLGAGEGVAAQVFESLGISEDEARAQIEQIIPRGTEVATGAIPFTPRAKKVLELSLREALQLGHRYIGSEHILLGLIREGEGVAGQVMAKLGADAVRARASVLQLLESVPAEPEPAGTRSTKAVIHSLETENHRLRAEVDRLRHLLLELNAEADEPSEEPAGEG